MGLDMYLSTNSKKVCKAANKASGTEDWYFAGGTAIYWRKANQIHRWFVENVQYGEDDCRAYEVNVEQLIELRNACEKVINASKLVPGTHVNGYINGNPNIENALVIEDPTVAMELLPNGGGFFFGSQEYDEWYLDDLKRTMSGIDAILDNVERYKQHSTYFTWDSWREKGDPDEWDVTFTYHASW